MPEEKIDKNYMALAILPLNTLIGKRQAGHFAPRTQPLTAGLSL